MIHHVHVHDVYDGSTLPLLQKLSLGVSFTSTAKKLDIDLRLYRPDVLVLGVGNYTEALQTFINSIDAKFPNQVVLYLTRYWPEEDVRVIRDLFIPQRDLVLKSSSVTGLKFMLAVIRAQEILKPPLL